MEFSISNTKCKQMSNKNQAVTFRVFLTYSWTKTRHNNVIMAVKNMNIKQKCCITSSNILANSCSHNNAITKETNPRSTIQP